MPANVAVEAALRELAARGLIAETLTPTLLTGGNRDRHPDRPVITYRAQGASGQALKLSLGPGLVKRGTAQAEFARACPRLVAPPHFAVAVAGTEALGEPFLEGTDLEGLTGAEASNRPRTAFATACSELANTEEASDEDSRRKEWQQWADALLAETGWTPEERRHLEVDVLPRLYAALTFAPPATRWSSGDFHSANLICGQGGEVHLVDLEHLGRTHFFTEDAVRFHVLSPVARRHPDWFAAAMPFPGPAWHLYFWLRQFQLELQQNSPDYIARVAGPRRALIRQLAEGALGCVLRGWSVEATVSHCQLEESRWLYRSGPIVRLAGWCHVPEGGPLRAMLLYQHGRLLQEVGLQDRPDVQRHFHDAAEALRSGFAIEADLADPAHPLELCTQTGDGVLLTLQRLAPRELPGYGPVPGDYPTWAAVHDPTPPPEAREENLPSFSILLPVYNTPADYLRDCLASVRAQYHTNWELCLVDDASTAPGFAALLSGAAANDRRIRVRRRDVNGGIARASNDALAMATGEYVVLLDHDDLLRPHALQELALKLRAEPHLDAIYSDEDKISPGGDRVLPFLKPGYSPEFLLGVMYVGHVLCVRTAAARQAGGFDPVFDGVQDYEFFLRLTEHTRHIAHLPKILYHWRQSPGSSALHGNVKGDMDEKHAAAVRAHLQRRGRRDTVTPLGGHRVRVAPVHTAITHERVAIEAGEPALDALRRAARRSTSDVLILMAAEPRKASPRWEETLAALATLPDSGCVAPVHLSSEGRVLESGCTPQGGQLLPLMRGFDADSDGYNGSLRCTREVSAVSIRCIAIRRDLVPAAMGDDWPEFLATLRDSGYRHRVTPLASLQHEETWHTPGAALSPSPSHDPFYNRHFDPAGGEYRLRDDYPAAAPLWHLDTPAPSPVSSGCLHWRGWCFWAGRTLAEIRLHFGDDFTWPCTLGLPRPDVRARYPAVGADCGFELRIKLPVGRHVIRAEAVDHTGQSCPLFRQEVTVTARHQLRYRLGQEPELLLPFQFLAGPSHPPGRRPSSGPPRVRPRSDRPRLTVVTPSYNQARFLGEAVRSVLDQDAAVDYVVQDGGSTDGSIALLEKIAGEQASVAAASSRPRLLRWKSAPDGGQADAIRQGFAGTKGAPDDIMAWLNSDDFYLPGTLAYVADFFAEHPSVDALYGDRIVVDELSREIGRWHMPKHNPEVLRLNDFIPQETLFWRRRIWDKVGGVDPTFRFAMDWDLLLRFQDAGATMVRVPHCLACFRVHPAQKTSAAMHRIGLEEIDRLRTRTHGRRITALELASDPRLRSYLRSSARIELVRNLGRKA